MTAQPRHAAELFREAISRFGDTHPAAVRAARRGERIIHQGAVSDECFLLKDGTVSILVRRAGTGYESEVALRYENALLGETAFLQKNAPRTASVQVVSESATLIRLSRQDVFSLLGENAALAGAIDHLRELSATRQIETQQVLKGQISVENRLMSVLIGDLHNFSTVSESVEEEQSNALLFDFLELAQEAAASFGAVFEDQGDGFRVLFRDAGHAGRAIGCAVAIRDDFLRLRDAWRKRDEQFGFIGLGVGICSDYMSIRKRDGSLQADGRVLSHAMNIAAAISKHRVLPSDADVFIDRNTYSLSRGVGFVIDAVEPRWLEKLHRKYDLHAVRGVAPKPPAPSESSGPHRDVVVSARAY